MEPLFLEVEDLLEAHEDNLRRYGGSPGVRDIGALESAVWQARAGFGTCYFHEDLEAMAAAYLYHVAQAHAFVDGNKRMALWAALTFLRVNGVRVDSRWQDLAKLTLETANGKRTKDQLAAFFRSAPRERDAEA